MIDIYYLLFIIFIIVIVLFVISHTLQLIDAWFDFQLHNLVIITLSPYSLKCKYVNRDPRTIKYVYKPSYELQILASRHNYIYMYDVKHLHPKLQLDMIKYDKDHISHITYPTEEVVRYVIEHYPNHIGVIKTKYLSQDLKSEIKLLII
ncbi:MAG: hypothetical protein DRG78_00360 [Epsilonproteobacteria bacterium]|nr:MAG: hypothetical protein DRG78_00360 [Campylobacterota bacterium]